MAFSKAAAEYSLWAQAVSSAKDGSSYACSVMREVLNAVFRFQVLGCWSRRTQTIVGGANEGLSSVMKEKDTEMYFVFCPGRENMG